MAIWRADYEYLTRKYDFMKISPILGEEPRTEETKNQRKKAKNQTLRKEYKKSQISRIADNMESL